MKISSRIQATYLLAFAGSILAQNDGLTVSTQQGAVTGSLVTTGVRQFLGIPFATAGRWQAPQAPPQRSTTLNATKFGDSCPQSFTNGFNQVLLLTGAGLQTGVPQSENCQNLNIWAPTLDRKQGAAVMIWIYGGSFAYGSSNFDFYKGQNFVQDNDDIVVVTINYRLNIFGQPSAPQLASPTRSQNFGFLDQKAAIEWVHDNIANFGGDPNRIILFGESAGSFSVDAYSYANPNDGIVKGLIQESASLAGNSLLAPQLNVTTVASWMGVAALAGCGSVNTPQQLSCMEAIPSQQLENLVIQANAAFAPVPDGITYFFDFNARSAAGRFLKVPLLIGNNAQEGDLFAVAAETLAPFVVTIPGFVTEGSSDFTDVVFNCPASLTAADRVKAGVPTWRYHYEAVFPNINNNRPDLRAYHFSEVPLVFGTFNSSKFTQPVSSTEIALSKYMQSAWVAFARDPVNGLSNFAWPKYNPSTASIARLGSTANQTGVTFGSSGDLDSGCSPLALSQKSILAEDVLLFSAF